MAKLKRCVYGRKLKNGKCIMIEKKRYHSIPKMIERTEPKPKTPAQIIIEDIDELIDSKIELVEKREKAYEVRDSQEYYDWTESMAGREFYDHLDMIEKKKEKIKKEINKLIEGETF